MKKTILFYFVFLFLAVSCGGNENKTKQSENPNDTLNTVTEISEQEYTFENFISDCIEVKVDFFDTELSLKASYPKIYNYETKNEEKVINYLSENYKKEYEIAPSRVSIPLLFTSENYYLLLVEYEDDLNAICQDVFVVDKVGKLISQNIEITYQYSSSEMLTENYLKLRRNENNTIRIVSKQLYEARNENAVVPDSPTYHFYEITHTGNMKERKKEDFGNLIGYNFALKENNLKTEYCIEFQDIGAQFTSKKQTLENGSISIKKGSWEEEKGKINILWTEHLGTRLKPTKNINNSLFSSFSKKINEQETLIIDDILANLFTAKDYILDSVSYAKPNSLLYFCLKSNYISFPFTYYSPSVEMDMFEPENSINPFFLSQEITILGQDAMPDIINKIAKTAKMKFFKVGSFYTSYNYKVFMMAFTAKNPAFDFTNYNIVAYVISPDNELKSAFYLFIGEEKDSKEVKLIDEKGNFIFTDKFENTQIKVKINSKGFTQTIGEYKELNSN